MSPSSRSSSSSRSTEATPVSTPRTARVPSTASSLRTPVRTRFRGHLPRPHSSADTGFFQEVPKLGNQFLDDEALQRVLSLYLPPYLLKPLFQDLQTFASIVLAPNLLSWLEDAEKHPPTLATHDAFARPGHILRTSEGWRKLSDFGAQAGMVAEGYFGECGRLGQFARYFLFAPSAALTTCPAAMTDGAARLLSDHSSPPPPSSPVGLDDPPLSAREALLQRRVFKDAVARLTSRDPEKRWTSGQWMTERAGGSDVSRSETTATYSPLSPSGAPSGKEMGPWIVNGHKYFSSATDADAAILLARTNAGISAFFAPMNHPEGGTNGVRIVRLKEKLGTRALPTAEVEIKGMKAWLIGREGDGIREISTILNITRVHNSISASSFARRALEVAKVLLSSPSPPSPPPPSSSSSSSPSPSSSSSSSKRSGARLTTTDVKAYSRVRVISDGRTLSTTPLHLRTLAHLELLTRAATHLSFFSAHLLSLTEPNFHPSPYVKVHADQAPVLLRLFSSLTKALTAKLAQTVISESLEALGGVGYLENEEPLNLARLMRDAQVLSIWEGTTNVLITDLVAALKGTSRSGGQRRDYKILGSWIRENLGAGDVARSGAMGEILEACKVRIWNEWMEVDDALETRSEEDLLATGRTLLWRIGWCVVGVLFLVDARKDGDEVAAESVKRWAVESEGPMGMRGGNWYWDREGVRKDTGMVFGEGRRIRPRL